MVVNRLPGERLLLESDDKSLVLTTHRVRYDRKRAGNSDTVSIMLEDLASCAIVRRNSPLYLGCAALFFCLGLFSYAVARNEDALIMSIFLSIASAIIHAVSARQVLEVASAGATIQDNAAGLSVDALKKFIDETERAKDARYLLLRGEPSSQVSMGQ